MSCILKNGVRECPIYVLYDSGCSSAAILSVAAESVGAVSVPHRCKLATFDNDQCVVRDFTSFEIMSLDRTVCVSVPEALVGDSLTVSGDRPPTNGEITPFKYLQGVVFDELPDATIGVILGAPYAHLWMDGETRFHSSDYPLAKRSKLGWVLIGPSLDKDKADKMDKLNAVVRYRAGRILYDFGYIKGRFGEAYMQYAQIGRHKHRNDVTGAETTTLEKHKSFSHKSLIYSAIFPKPYWLMYFYMSVIRLNNKNIKKEPWK